MVGRDQRVVLKSVLLEICQPMSMPPFAVGLAVLYGSVSANLMAVVFEVSMNQIAPHSEDADSNIHERAQHLDDVPAPW